MCKTKSDIPHNVILLSIVDGSGSHLTTYMYIHTYTYVYPYLILSPYLSLSVFLYLFCLSLFFSLSLFFFLSLSLSLYVGPPTGLDIGAPLRGPAVGDPPGPSDGRPSGPRRSGGARPGPGPAERA